MSRAFFVTGTDTGAGKTLVTSALLHAAAQRGLRSLGLKPLASGSERAADGRLLNEDALALQQAASIKLPYEAVNMLSLEPAIAPHLAAEEQGLRLSAGELAAHCTGQAGHGHDLLLVEGAGGWRVPLNDTETFADLARLLGFPVILVVGMRLGCVNHALLTAEAIAADGLQLAGWVGSQIDPEMSRVEQNLHTLRARIAAPCIGFLPYRAGIGFGDAAQGLDLDRLLRA
jgi:dethiobiotin synthetase